MKARNTLDTHIRCKYLRCYVQPKLDGQRLMIDKDGNAWSKQGDFVNFRKGTGRCVRFAITCGGLDGEIYAGLVIGGWFEFVRRNYFRISVNLTTTPES